MIVKFLKPASTFGGVLYNMDKVGLGKAELMAVLNFGALNGLEEMRPTDYLNYLKAITAGNKNVSMPQLHVALSTTGETHDKVQLTGIARDWLEKMGYGKQPCLIFFHKDTGNNHVHIVSTRIDQEGRKISSAFEHLRAIKTLKEIMELDQDQTVRNDLEKARSYRFSTVAQFKLLLEKQGYTINGPDLLRSGRKIAEVGLEKVRLRDPDPQRAVQLRAIFKKYSGPYDAAGFADYLKIKMGIELVFHSKDGKPAYGYTIIDHAQRNVYKGSQVMPLKELLFSQPSPQASPKESHPIISPATQQATTLRIHIAGDIDDEAIHGRRRKKRSRGHHR